MPAVKPLGVTSDDSKSINRALQSSGMLEVVGNPYPCPLLELKTASTAVMMVIY